MKKEKTLREHAIVIENLAFLGIGALILSKWLSESALFWPLFLGGLGLSIACIIYQKKYYICPVCGKQLPLFRKGIAFCPHCGTALEQ